MPSVHTRIVPQSERVVKPNMAMHKTQVSWHVVCRGTSLATRVRGRALARVLKRAHFEQCVPCSAFILQGSCREAGRGHVWNAYLPCGHLGCSWPGPYINATRVPANHARDAIYVCIEKRGILHGGYVRKTVGSGTQGQGPARAARSPRFVPYDHSPLTPPYAPCFPPGYG